MSDSERESVCASEREREIGKRKYVLVREREIGEGISCCEIWCMKERGREIL